MTPTESEPGTRTPSEILLQRTDAPDGTGSTPARGTVLLVEDDAVLRTTYAGLLRGEGWTVLAAPDGFNALLVAGGHRGRIDLLVTDILLPQMSGLELWRKLSGFRPEAQVVFITGNFEQARVLLGGESDPPPVLGKPFTPRALVEAVQGALADSPFLRPKGPPDPA